jgi:hypothetical protein
MGNIDRIGGVVLGCGDEECVHQALIYEIPAHVFPRLSTEFTCRRFRLR